MSKAANQKLIIEFVQNISIEKGLLPNTIFSYKNDLTLLAKFLEKQQKNFLNCQQSNIVDYLKDLFENKISASSQSRKISTFKHFFKFLLSENIIKNNPASNLELPKKPIKNLLNIYQKKKF